MAVRPQQSRDASAAPRLFDRSEMDLRPTGLARLRRLAARPGALTREDRCKAEDRRVMGRLREWGADLARRFDLTYAALDPERDGITEHYGICYEDGVILIRLRHARTGRLLKESSLVDTLCHELAHLKHLNHGPRFKRLYQQILDRARKLGYYRPGPADQAPRQRSLFEGCGSA